MDVCGAVVSPNRTKTNTNPVNRCLQGVGGGVGAVRGGRRCCFGDLVMSRMGGGCGVARLHKNEKKTL